MQLNTQYQRQRARLERPGPAPVADLAAYREARAHRVQAATLDEAKQAWAARVNDLHYGQGVAAARALELAGPWPTSEPEAEAEAEI